VTVYILGAVSPPVAHPRRAALKARDLVLSHIQLIRNVGRFDSVSSGAAIALPKLTVVYAENGRGKTTLSAILRSLGTGNPAPITERKRLSAAHDPHVVVQAAGAAINFQNGAWSQTLPNLAVFDDVFIDENVFSGLSVESGHRQNLHELILGAQGVTLGKAFQGLVDQIEEHNKTLRAKADAIPASVRGNLDAEAFCALQAKPGVADEIQAAERLLAAAREQDAVRSASGFDPFELPSFDLDALAALLAHDLADLDAAAAAQVQAHLASLGSGGEGWVAEGMRHMPATGACPFCAQDLSGSALVAHYRAYFSAGYEGLKRAIADGLGTMKAEHGEAVPAAFERAVRVWVERRQFWSKFCGVSEIDLDTAAVLRAWNVARDALRDLLTAKQAAPLERLEISPGAHSAVAAFETERARVAALSQALQETNTTIKVVKEQAAAGNPTSIAADLARLRAIQSRYTPEIDSLCNAYRAEKLDKAETETKRNAARDALDTYRKTVFPSYETAINDYLRKFGAGFRLEKVASATTRAGSTCTYNVAIGTATIAVGGNATPGNPSFRSTLSAGDRNTLALAFFFASLDRDPNIGGKVVVIDDPITSLDEHRHLTTVQEIGRLAQRVGQRVVLSHSKPFLCQVWEGADKTAREAIEIARSGDGSTLRGWVVHHDLISEHDRRHALLRDYLVNSPPDNRKVAEALRPVLERFVRVAYPDWFAPGDMLGKFVNLCQQRLGTSDEILDAARTQELNDILAYANRFHHDTNRAYETEVVNDGQLLDFVKRTLAWTRR
jgi:wobble nucleotide-excising tRNase